MQILSQDYIYSSQKTEIKFTFFLLNNSLFSEKASVEVCREVTRGSSDFYFTAFRVRLKNYQYISTCNCLFDI